MTSEMKNVTYEMREASCRVNETELKFRGVVLHRKIFGDLEDELFKYQEDHPRELVPFINFYNDQNFDELLFLADFDWAVRVNMQRYHFNLVERGWYKKVVQEFIVKHPEWSKIIARYDKDYGF